MTWSDATFEPLFRALYPRVLRAAELFLGERGAAEDVAQEAFTRLLSRRPMPAGDAERWVFKVARNLAVDRVRAARRLTHLDASTPVAAAPEEERPERVAALRAAIAGLPSRQREVVGLRVYGELSYEAIAAAVGRSLGSVKQELHRAREALKARVIGMGLEDVDA
jgi:RNA polymerase sigma-70 factor (ECF subfamily)